jgi:hypothetical protein
LVISNEGFAHGAAKSAFSHEEMQAICDYMTDAWATCSPGFLPTSSMNTGSTNRDTVISTLALVLPDRYSQARPPIGVLAEFDLRLRQGLHIQTRRDPRAGHQRDQRSQRDTCPSRTFGITLSLVAGFKDHPCTMSEKRFFRIPKSGGA